MDQTLATVVAAIATVVTPLVVFVMQRATAKKLDAFDKKREDARTEREDEERRNAEWQAAMTGGMRSMLRAELLHEYNKWTERGYCPMDAKEYVEKTYLSYHALSGNGIGTAMYQQVMELPMSQHDHGGDAA